MKVFLHNPTNGAPIKNWYDGSERWSLDVGEVKAFPTKAAEALSAVFGFLRVVSEEEYELMLARLEEKEKNPPKVKVDASGDLVPKADAEVAAEVEKTKKEIDTVKKVLAKVKKAPDAKGENPPYSEWSRGEVFAEVGKRGLEIKGLGKSRISKEQLINILENDDNK